MMNDGRLKLHAELCLILGSNKVYFQPPETLKITYPAIIYSRYDIENKHANDGLYDQNFKYKVTVIDHDPDSEIVERMSKFKFAIFDRHYSVNGLNHDQFTVSYKK